MDLDPQQQEAADAQAEARRVQVEDIRWMLKHKEGRRVMWRLLSEAGIYRTSFNNSGSVTAFNEGKRHIGLVLVNEINEVAPEQFLAMLKEHAEK